MIRNDGRTPAGTDAEAGHHAPDLKKAEPQRDRKSRLLAVGNMVPPRQSSDAADAADLTCLPFTEVCAEALDRIRPDVVFSSLVGPGFDCLDLAERLVTAGYRGKYRAVAPQVPDPTLVRREITERFPALDFDLIVLADRD